MPVLWPFPDPPEFTFYVSKNKSEQRPQTVLLLSPHLREQHSLCFSLVLWMEFTCIYTETTISRACKQRTVGRQTITALWNQTPSSTNGIWGLGNHSTRAYPTSLRERVTEGMLAFSSLSRERTISSKAFRYRSLSTTFTWKGHTLQQQALTAPLWESYNTAGNMNWSDFSSTAVYTTCAMNRATWSTHTPRCPGDPTGKDRAITSK